MKIFFDKNYCCHDNRISKTCKKVYFKMFYCSQTVIMEISYHLKSSVEFHKDATCICLYFFFIIISVQVSHYVFPDEIIDVCLACLHMTCTVIDSCVASFY